MSEFPEHLSELVAIPSVSGNEQEIAAYVADVCSSVGHRVSIIGDNVAVHIPGEDGSRAFLVNGHLDTVPSIDLWDEDPLVLREDPENADSLIGLGVSDMKSGLAVMLEIGEEATERNPPTDLWLLFSSKEETDSSGSVEMTEWLSNETAERYVTMGGLILEPTDASFVGVGHRGSTAWNVISSGPGGHASQDFTGETPAIEKVGNLLVSLPELREAWGAQYTDPVLGRPTINPTILSGGSAANVVPLQTELTLDLRVTPQLAEDLHNVRIGLEDEYGVSIGQDWEPEPALCDESELIYRAARSALPLSDFMAFPGASDQFAFQAHDIPMLVYGPGDSSSMHQPNERVSVSAIEKSRQDIGQIMLNFATM